MNDKERSNQSIPMNESIKDEYIQECEALVEYIGRYGNVLLEGNRDKFQCLTELVSRYRQGEAGEEDWQRLVQAYSDITQITMTTRGVNGRSVRDTMNAGEEHIGLSALVPIKLPTHQRPLSIALWLLILALILHFVENLASNVSDPRVELDWMLYPYYFVQYLAPLLVPAVWGGLGACVFLMKQVSDRLAAFTYEEVRLKGYGTRILLGAIFGVVIVQWLFDLHTGDKEIADSLGQAVTAFAAGLGTKAVYAAFEELIEVIASRIRGVSSKK